MNFENNLDALCQLLERDARDVDQSGVIPSSHFDELAAFGLYGAFAPRDEGGIELEATELFDVIERLAMSCLSTTFVLIQHLRLLGSCLDPGSPAFLRNQRADIISGTIRGGVALGGLLPGPARLSVTATTDGWRLNGEAPWVSGWGMVDSLFVAARGPEQTVVSLQLAAHEQHGLEATRQHLTAINATNSVKLNFTDLEIPAEQLIGRVSYEPQIESGDRLRLNGSLALGLARRSCALLDDPAMSEELLACRYELDHAQPSSMPEARARASEFAVRAAHALCVQRGSSSVLSGDVGERSTREASLLLSFGSRPAIRQSLLRRLGATTE